MFYIYIFYYYYYFKCLSILPACMSVCHVQACCLKKSKSRHRVPCNWSNRSLWVAEWVLGIEAQSSWRAAALLVAEPSSPESGFLNQTQSNIASFWEAPPHPAPSPACHIKILNFLSRDFCSLTGKFCIQHIQINFYAVSWGLLCQEMDLIQHHYHSG